MFYGLLSSFFYSMCCVNYKKALTISKRYITDSFYQFLAYGCISLFLLATVLIVERGIARLDIFILWLLFINSSINVICEYLEQYAYRSEKISVLTPYHEFEWVFATILGFTFFANNTLITFLTSLFAGAVLIIGSTDFKKFKINKYCMAIMLVGFLTSLRFIVFGYVLLRFSELTSLFFSMLMSFVIIFVVVLFKKEMPMIAKSPWKLNKFIFAEWLYWTMANLIILYLIKNTGIVQTVLVSMTFMAVSLGLSYIYFKDIPTKKDIVVTLIISACIVFWVMV